MIDNCFLARNTEGAKFAAYVDRDWIEGSVGAAGTVLTKVDYENVLDMFDCKVEDVCFGFCSLGNVAI